MKGRDERKRYKQYRARKEQLPASYREAIDAVERYALRFGPAAGETVLTMLEDLAGIFEQGAKPAPRSARSSATTRCGSPRFSSLVTRPTRGPARSSSTWSGPSPTRNERRA